jgi:LPXTG-motif cell wall-anchored protein
MLPAALKLAMVVCVLAGAVLALTASAASAAGTPRPVVRQSDRSPHGRDVRGAAAGSRAPSDHGAGNPCDPGHSHANPANIRADAAVPQGCATASVRPAANNANARTSAGSPPARRANVSSSGLNAGVSAAGQAVQGAALASTGGSPVYPLVAGMVLLLGGGGLLLARRQGGL